MITTLLALSGYGPAIAVFFLQQRSIPWECALVMAYIAAFAGYRLVRLLRVVESEFGTETYAVVARHPIQHPGEVVAFAVSYLSVAFAPQAMDWRGWAALAIVATIMGSLALRMNLLRFNFLVFLLGYRVFQVTVEEAGRAQSGMLLAKCELPADAVLNEDVLIPFQADKQQRVFMLSGVLA